jgi:hypothetical protein
MVSLLWIAAFGSLLGIMVLWGLTMVFALRPFGVYLPAKFVFRGPYRRARELRTALKGCSTSTYILVAGFLFVAYPLLAGLSVFTYIIDYIIPTQYVVPPYSLRKLVGEVIVFTILGVWIGLSEKKKADKEFGPTSGSRVLVGASKK